MNDPCLFVYITVPNAAEAEGLCGALVRERLAACANILEGVRSMYWWQGSLEKAEECVCILKTTGSRFDALRDRALQLHSYTTPCIVALPIADGNPDFLTWIRAESAPSSFTI